MNVMVKENQLYTRAPPFSKGHHHLWMLLGCIFLRYEELNRFCPKPKSALHCGSNRVI